MSMVYVSAFSSRLYCEYMYSSSNIFLVFYNTYHMELIDI